MQITATFNGSFDTGCLKLKALNNITNSCFSKWLNFGRRSYNFDHVKSSVFHESVVIFFSVADKCIKQTSNNRGWDFFRQCSNGPQFDDMFNHSDKAYKCDKIMIAYITF